jgi:S-adenosyl methyltransferase
VTGVPLDLTVPSIARVSGYVLGGKDAYAADRAAAHAMERVAPGFARTIRHNRRFLERAVIHLGPAGAGQFLHIGCGLSARCNVHQIAQATRS